MKLKPILSAAFAVAIATAARADVTVEITGATAFRGAANQAILNAFNSAGALGTTYSYAHSGATAGSLNGANFATFVGTFPGVPGVTTIRTSWNGSTEGIRAVALGGAFSPSFLTAATITAPGENFNKTAPTSVAFPKFSFSDVRQSSSPIRSPSLNPADARVGVVTFTMIANEGAPANLNTVTAQQFKALFTQGFQPLSLFSGDPADTRLVFATGRNDGSGTRTTYLAETGYGVANVVNQYIATVSDASAITTIRRVPAGDGANASTLWGNDVAGNGGYASGSSLRTDMGKTSASTRVLDSDNSELLPAGSNIVLLTWLSTGDALSAATAGAKVLGYNGVQITPIATA